MKSKLKALGTKRLKLNHHNLLSSFAFNFDFRHYTWVRVRGRRRHAGVAEVDDQRVGFRAGQDGAAQQLGQTTSARESGRGLH